MELLKRGIIIGLGVHDMNKKQIKDFIKKLTDAKLISKEQAKELVDLISERKTQLNKHLSDRIESFIKDLVKKEELATLSHIEYLEKRLDLLEEELYNLLLEKYISNVDDDEIAKLLKDLDLDKTILEDEGKKQLKDFDEEWLKSEDSFFEPVVDIDESKDELEDLLRPSKKVAKKIKKKKKVATKKTAPKKAATKRKATKKKKKK